MNKYQNGVIYTLNVAKQQYVGSTCDFDVRKSQHKSSLNRYDNRKVYKAIRENGGEWQMEIYENYPCDNKDELLMEEERIRTLLNAELNSNACRTGLTPQQYKKVWYSKNRERDLERRKIKFACPLCGCRTDNRNMAKHQKTKKCKRLAAEKINEKNENDLEINIF